MKSLLVLILVSIFSVQTFADLQSENSELELPVGLEIMTKGYSVAPIVQCPRPAKKYVDMLAQLDQIRNRIKSEACKNSGAIDSIENGVADLQSLITDKRKSFVELIKKGTTEGQQLTSGEVKELESYIDQVVKKTAVVTGLLSNKACFDEPAKFFTLGTLSSVIGEVSGAVGALAGPFGAKISLAGKVVSGLLSSLNTIIEARKNYDMDVEVDRVNYLNTLCAYNDLKSDFDKVTKTLHYDRRLRQLRDSAQSLLDALAESCPDCEIAMVDFQDRFYNERNFVVRQEGVNQFDVQLTADQLNPEVLINQYFVRGFVEEEGSLVSEPSQASSQDQQATATALLTKAWAETEREKLFDSETEGDSDELRKPIVDRQNAIEDVLYRDVAYYYVNYHRKGLEREYSKLQGMGRQVVSQMYSFRPKADPKMDYGKLKSSLAIAFHDLFRTDLEFEQWDNPLLQTDESIMMEYVERVSAQMMDQFDLMRRQYSLMQQRCQFFRNSLFEIQRAPYLVGACDRAESVMKGVMDEMAKVETTSFGKEFPMYFKVFKEDSTRWTGDWLASVTEYMNVERENRL